MMVLKPSTSKILLKMNKINGYDGIKTINIKNIIKNE